MLCFFSLFHTDDGPPEKQQKTVHNEKGLRKNDVHALKNTEREKRRKKRRRKKNRRAECYRVVVLVSFGSFFSSRLVLFLVFSSSAVYASLACYNLSRTQWVHVREKTKKTCPRNVSISVKLIFWNLCYTSIKLIPSHIPSLFFRSLCTETNIFFSSLTWIGRSCVLYWRSTVELWYFFVGFGSLHSLLVAALNWNKKSRWQISIITDGEKNVFITVEYTYTHIIRVDTHLERVKVKFKQFFLSSYLKFCNFRYHLIARTLQAAHSIRMARLECINYIRRVNSKLRHQLLFNKLS